jgi:hypothetical protein
VTARKSRIYFSILEKIMNQNDLGTLVAKCLRIAKEDELDLYWVDDTDNQETLDIIRGNPACACVEFRVMGIGDFVAFEAAETADERLAIIKPYMDRYGKKSLGAK